MTVPLEITGTLPEPDVSVDETKLVTDSIPGRVIKGTVRGIRSVGETVTGSNSDSEPTETE